jgi:hypothetical protein
LTWKHKNATNNSVLEINGNIKNDENSNTIHAIYFCDVCNFQCKHQSNYDKHLLTEKHQKNVLGNTEEMKNICNQCNKEYTNYSGLWKHKKKCVVSKNENENLQNSFTPQLFMEVLKESKELQNVLMEQNKELQNKLLEKENQLLEQNKELHNKLIEKDSVLIEQNNKIIELASKQTTNINSYNTNNQQFNLQFFLNETCKDAMNLVDFVNSLKLTPEDLKLREDWVL